MVSDKNPRLWSITYLNPDKTASELASDLADHFTSVTNQSIPLTEIPQSNIGPGLVRLLDAKQVSARLKKFKKPFSRVDGDIPRGVVTEADDALAVPMVETYNYCFVGRSWPKIWKKETVVPVLQVHKKLKVV